tara:strand:- start:467 stop:637 length:171 start_codon:yes stop_codon:yes gene_type:complete
MCTGCGRTTDEIQEWRDGNESTQQMILRECVARLDEDSFEVWVNKYKAKVKRLTTK